MITRTQLEELGHLSEETIAELAESGSHSEVGRRAVRHMAQCRTCMAAYTDAVRYRAAWISAPEMFEGPGAASPGGRPRFLPQPQVALAAGLLVVAGLAGMVWLRGPVHRTPVAAMADASVVAMIESASSGDLVFPGGEAGAARSDAAYRAGADAEPGTLESLEALRASYERGPRTADLLYSLAAGLAAVGRNDLAHDYVSEGRSLHARDARFLVLEAVLARRLGDGPEALRALREARRLSPDDATLALDEGLLLAEAGEAVAAGEQFREVIRRAPGSPLAQRAQRSLDGLPAR